MKTFDRSHDKLDISEYRERLSSINAIDAKIKTLQAEKLRLEKIAAATCKPATERVRMFLAGDRVPVRIGAPFINGTARLRQTDKSLSVNIWGTEDKSLGWFSIDDVS